MRVFVSREARKSKCIAFAAFQARKGACPSFPRPIFSDGNCIRLGGARFPVNIRIERVICNNAASNQDFEFWEHMF